METPKDENKTEGVVAVGSTAVLGGEHPRPTIEQLEKMLASGKELDIEIQPDGSIKAVPKGTAQNASVKPITMNQALGGEYTAPTPKTNPWRWMETWLVAYDRDNGGTKGKEIMDWIWQQPTGAA